MKKAGRNFGHIDSDYRLQHIFLRTIAEFYAADKLCTELEAKFRAGEKISHHEMFRQSELRREAGVTAILTASAFLEQLLYAYAIHHIDAEAYKRHLDNLRAISKWIVLPKLCQNKTIDESDARIRDLKKLIEVRNAITHPKRVVIKDNLGVIDKAQTEGEEFLDVARKLEKTVAGCKDLLK